MVQPAGRRARRRSGAASCRPVTDLSASLTDLAETAAVIANLDLVLAVDTAIVHLAGALGRPCWMMLPFAPDWRWLLERTDSPWYPTLRLFRQPAPGDWDKVIAEIREALAGLIGDTKLVRRRRRRRGFCGGDGGLQRRPAR